MIPTFLIENDKLFHEIVKLAHEKPNDMDLGNAVRALISENNRMNKAWVPVAGPDKGKLS
jgi:hypothetical protein